MNRPYVERIVRDRFANTDFIIYAAPRDGFPGADWDAATHIARCVKAIGDQKFAIMVGIREEQTIWTDEAIAEYIINELATHIHDLEATHLDPAE